MIRRLLTLWRRRPTPPPSEFDRTIAAILIRDAGRQELDAQAAPSTPSKPIGLRKILADLPD
jgi:hypothetical protein